MSLKIDAHQHYWNIARGDYEWMPPGHPVLARTYLPADLAATLKAQGIAGTVLVQAAASVGETEYLLGLADACQSIAAVVGWVDFEDPQQREELNRLAQHPKFVGVRPMIQDIPELDWMLRPGIQWAYEALIDLDLTFDALGFPPHLANFHELLTRYPEMRVVVDHGMKPQIRDHAQGPAVFDHWSAGMARLAEETQAHCKLSGLVTEAGEDWTLEDLAPFAAHIITNFGAERIMWGSDWPVCQLRATYDQWLTAATTLTADLDGAARDRVFGGTAVEFYGLSL